MRPRMFLAVVVALALFAAAGWGRWWHDRPLLKNLPFTRQRLAFLEGENQRLHTALTERQKDTEAVVARDGRKDIERVVTDLRGLPFRSPVIYREIPRSELPAILRQKLSQQVPDQEFEHTSVAFGVMGLVPRGLDLKKTYLALLGEQVGAFYDQHSRELFTFSGQSLTNSQNRVILAHELTHALEDQHFHLERLPLEAKGNDDRALAASALVEGDATLVMNRYLLGNLTAATVQESLATAMTTDVRQLAMAPRFLRETLVFPYLKGQEFCQTLYDRGGWSELARAFARPPASTSQILHPERFLAEPPEEPVGIDFPDASVLAVQPIADNVLGEFGCLQLFAVWLKNEPQAVATAAGWRGDRYRVYGDAQAASYVWETTWRARGQAEDFAAMAKLALGDSAEGKQSGVRTQPHSNGRFVLVVADASRQRVLIINAQDIRWFDALKLRFIGNYPAIATAQP